jgi:hypothetical protein
MSFWIPTFTGKLIDIRDPDPKLIDPIDIAVSLARKPRWNGHTQQAITVAEHSLAGSYEFAGRREAFKFLLHDAQEAYLGDVSRPVKLLLGKVWDELEAMFAQTVALRFGLDATAGWEHVGEVDDALLARERRDQVHPAAANDPRWEWHREPDSTACVLPQKPYFVIRAFLERFEELSGERIDWSLLPMRRATWRRQQAFGQGGAA